MQADLQNGITTGYNITYRSLTENDNGFVTTGPDDRLVGEPRPRNERFVHPSPQKRFDSGLLLFDNS